MELGILAKETHEQVIRFAPPLVIDKDTLTWAVSQIREALTAERPAWYGTSVAK
jgi:ornithine--oxo-acid transaminase